MKKLILFILFLIGIAIVFTLPITSKFLETSPEARIDYGEPSQKSNTPKPHAAHQEQAP